MKPTVLGPAAASDLYDQDFFEWTARNAELLRAGRLDEADLERIAEEIEDMGKGQHRELESRLAVLLAHLLKWQIQSERRSASWQATLAVQRIRIAKLLRSMPSLRNLLRHSVPDAYEEAVTKSVGQTGLPRKMFPPACPFSLDQILDPDFFPE